MKLRQILNGFKGYIRRRLYRIDDWERSTNYKILPDKLKIIIQYKKVFGEFPNLKSPKTFNEKLQYLKLYDRNLDYCKMVDKEAAKKYFIELLKKNGIEDPKQYIINTIGVYKSFNEINFDVLPEKFVLKCTHDSGSVVIVDDKEEFLRDKKRVKNVEINFTEALQNGFYNFFREWVYKGVEPKIIAERYMEDKESGEIRDYKFFCSRGHVGYFKIDFDRKTNHRANYFDRDGNLQDFGEMICPPDFARKLTMPKNLSKMIMFSELLSREIPFVRIDFYEINGKLYFGEITFYPAAGLGKFTSEEGEKKLSELIKI